MVQDARISGFGSREGRSSRIDTPSGHNLQMDDVERYSTPGTSSSAST